MSTVEKNIPLPYSWVEIKHPISSALKEQLQEASKKHSDGDSLLWQKDSHPIIADELYYEDGCLNISGSTNGINITLNIPVTKAIVIDIIEAYMKRLGRLKSLMEIAKKIDDEEK